MVELTNLTRAHVLALFRTVDVDAAERLLVESCGSNLPSMSNDSAHGLERIRFAAIRFSGGRMDDLREAIQLAQCDWRDLLVCAGFAEDIHAHSRWNPARFDTEVSDSWMAGENPTGVSFSLNQVVYLRDFPVQQGPVL